MPTVNTTRPSTEYIRWYTERIVLYISDPSQHPAQPERYQGDGARVVFTFDMVTRMHNLSLHSLPNAKPAAAAIWTIMRDIAYDTLRGAGELSRLSHCPPPLPVPVYEDHVQAHRAQRVPRNVWKSQYGR